MDFLTNAPPSGYDYEAEEYDEEHAPFDASVAPKLIWKPSGNSTQFKLLIVCLTRSAFKLIKSQFELQSVVEAEVVKNEDGDGDAIGLRVYKISGDVGIVDVHFAGEVKEQVLFDLGNGVIDEFKSQRPLLAPSSVKGLHAAILTKCEISSIPATSYIFQSGAVESLLKIKTILESILTSLFSKQVAFTPDIKVLRTFLDHNKVSALYL
ncbi:hypothetical protein HDU97_004660 [Phlyctochytrium planicorne]|nr:hypothetical protein HDU97_004660 [Phlyctochytrium planicorne]